MRLRDYLKINVWLLPIAIVLLTLSILIFGNGYLTTQNDYPLFLLTDGWTISHGDFYVEDAVLEDVNIGATDIGDTVTISCTLPEDFIPSGCLMFRSVLSTVSVDIDGNNVYEYGQSYYENGKLVPKHYHYIPVTKNDLGKIIDITFTVTEDDAFTGISSVYYGNRQELDRYFIQSRRLDLFIGIFLCLFGFMLLTLSSYLFMYHKRDLSLIFSSLISYILGAYNMCFNDIFCFISTNDYFFTVLEYITLYFVPLSIILFLLSTHKELNNNLSKVLIAANTLFPTITFILHEIGAVHINVFVSTLHFLAIIEATIFVPKLTMSIINEYKEKKLSPDFNGMTSDTILVIGLTIFIACCVIDIIKYNFFKVFGAGGEAYTNIGFMTIGALSFVLCLFVFYFYHGIEHINAAYMKEQLEGLAYTDALTGLMNRAKCMQYMAALQGKYAIISLDMDNLKPVNDTLGHLEGDNMIRSFADLLKLSFVGSQLIGRTGGDEFLVAIENPTPGICEKMIEDLENRMKLFNEGHSKINLSASCGFAYSTEVSVKSATEVFNLADSRMYKIKEEHHTNKINKIMADLLSEELLKGGEKHE